MTDDTRQSEDALPVHRDLFYDGQWHAPLGGEYKDTYSPGDGTTIAQVAQAGARDVEIAVKAAHHAFHGWRATPPAQRAACLRKAAESIRQHGEGLAFLDALNTGNPVSEMSRDAEVAAANLDYFSGLTYLVKGETVALCDGALHFTLREPLGVIARIVAYNHPVMFAASKIAAPLAAGNTVVLKPPEQAPLSSLKLAEIIGDVFPPGVVNVVPGGAECGKSLTIDPLVKKITLIGSVATGKAIQSAAAGTLKPTHFELGGKNALLAFADADIPKLISAVSKGMNWSWAGQSCGSLSRVFLHESLYDKVLPSVCEYVKAHYVPGPPTSSSTTMGSLIDKIAYDRVMSYIERAKQEGAELLIGGKPPSGVAGIEGGYFIEPTIFGNVQSHMAIAQEEIFGPVMSVFKWSDEAKLMQQVNSTPYGLTSSIWTTSTSKAIEMIPKVEAGFVWVNQVGRHHLGVPFGGYKESGAGREESIEEMLAFTQTKSVNMYPS